MSTIEMGKFRYGATEFMSYWLPMILFTGYTKTAHIANMMVFKCRKAYLTKEEALIIAKQELDEISASISSIQDLNVKATRIIESLKNFYYYPALNIF